MDKIYCEHCKFYRLKTEHLYDIDEYSGSMYRVLGDFCTKSPTLKSLYSNKKINFNNPAIKNKANNCKDFKRKNFISWSLGWLFAIICSSLVILSIFAGIEHIKKNGFILFWPAFFYGLCLIVFCTSCIIGGIASNYNEGDDTPWIIKAYTSPPMIALFPLSLVGMMVFMILMG